jgi:hypothetical protein
MIKYYIYHIKDFQWKNGKIGKIGCAKDHIERVSEQGYNEYTILEIHDCIYEASKREIELQKQYGYPVDRKPYYKCIEGRSKGGKIGGKKHVESGHIQRLGKIHGKINGRKAVESGHIQRLGKIQGKIQGKKNVESGHLSRIGKISGKKAVESGHLARIIKLSAENRKKPIIQYNKSGDFIAEWGSAADAATKLKLHRTLITQCCKGKLKTSGGYVWKYKS